MLHLIATFEPARIHFVPQFVEHYTKLGVQQFHLSLHFEPAVEPHVKDRACREAESALASVGVHLSAALVCPFDAGALRDHHDRLQAERCKSGDWIFWADIDEFQVYPRDFQELLQFAEAENIDYFWGRFVDRVAADRSLKPFDPAQSIWQQYPLQCQFSSELGLVTEKVTCARSGIAISRGNHAALTPGELRYYSQAVEIHHFKWDSSVVQRLGRRLLPDWRERCPWWVESEKILNRIDQEGGRIPGEFVPPRA